MHQRLRSLHRFHCFSLKLNAACSHLFHLSAPSKFGANTHEGVGLHALSNPMLFDPTSLAVCGGVTSVLAVVSALGVYTAYSLDDNESRTSRSGDGLLTAISAGVVLSVAWLHLLDDAQLMLKDLTMYPAANTAMMVGFLLMSVIH